MFTFNNKNTRTICHGRRYTVLTWTALIKSSSAAVLAASSDLQLMMTRLELKLAQTHVALTSPTRQQVLQLMMTRLNSFDTLFLRLICKLWTDSCLLRKKTQSLKTRSFLPFNFAITIRLLFYNTFSRRYRIRMGGMFILLSIP